jgi:diacylglycerol kinase
MIRFKRLFKSFHYAIKGLIKTFHEEQNLKVQTLVGVLVLLFGVYFKISLNEWCVLVFTITLVLVMELANSAVERVTDVLKPRINTYVKEVKDIMAAAVMLASLSAIIIGLLIFIPYIIKYFYE